MNKNQLNGYIRKRTHSLGWSMVVMGASFFLYYLGLFGTVQGPLAPETIGETLAGMGVEKIHMLTFFLSFFIMALTWNHIFNLVTYVTGSGFGSVKKGVVSHTVWIVALIFCAILICCE